jgi:hypothetical protein
VRSAGQVVHFGVPGARNANTLFFMFKRDTLCRTSIFASKMICGSHSVFRCNRGVKCRITIFHSRVRPVRSQQKAHWDMLCTTFVFLSGGICVSHSAFQCVRGVKHRCTIFILGWDWYEFHKKHAGTRYAELVFCLWGDLQVT